MENECMPDERDMRQMTDQQETEGKKGEPLIKQLVVPSDSATIAKKQYEFDVLSKVIKSNGDLTPLNPKELITYYHMMCEASGLNPHTNPFAIIRFQGKTILYTSKQATDQLRTLHNVSIKIVGREKIDNLYIVTAQAINKDGRTDESIGAMNLGGLKGDALANAIMKAETKAKRRVTLSIAGLGFLDESETHAIPDAKVFGFDTTTGEIIDHSSLKETKEAPPIESHELNHELTDMAQLLTDLHAEQNKGAALKTISQLSDNDKKKMKPLLDIKVMGWLSAISRPQITKEDYSRV